MYALYRYTTTNPLKYFNSASADGEVDQAWCKQMQKDEIKKAIVVGTKKGPVENVTVAITTAES